MAEALSYAVYAEHSPTTKKMKPGMNTRVFNVVEAQRGTEIRRL